MKFSFVIKDLGKRIFLSGVAALAFCWGASFAQAATLLIPKPQANLTQAPAVDLLAEGRPLDRDEVLDLMDSGRDVSLLDPSPSDLWTPAPLPATDLDSHAYPPEDALLQYDSDISSSRGLFRARVVDDDSRAFRLVVSLDSHAALARAALLRRLGYDLDSPRVYRKLRIGFPDLPSRDRFLDQLSDRTLTARSRWISGPLSETDPTVTLQDIVLEPGRIRNSPYQWGAVSASRLKGRRAIRALIVPLVLLDIPESINLFAWETGKLLSNRVSLTHPYADAFSETTYEDARWIARKIGALSREELREIIDAAHYPAPVAELVFQKLLARRNQVLELFDLAKELPRSERKFTYKTDLNIPPDVKAGKLLRESYEGYALRFTYGDPQSPLRRDELGRYLKLELIGGAIRTLTRKINDALDVRNVSDVGRKHGEDLQKEFIEHLQKRPGQPFSKPVGFWGGVTGGVRVNASRNVMTGTYYGSDSKLQLVDNIAAQASVGYFMSKDGIPKVVAGATGNLVIQRNYIHVRPVPNLKSALQTKWSWLFIPGFMRKLGQLIEPDPECRLPDVTNDGPSDFLECEEHSPVSRMEPEQISENLDSFLEDLKEGELFTITDSVLLGGSISATLPLMALLGADPLGVGGGLTFGPSVQGTLLRRTTFIRTPDGLQVYLQNAHTEALSAHFDFSFWMNVLRTSMTAQKGTGATRAFLLGHKPKDPAEQRKLAIALAALLKGNNSEILEEGYGKYRLKHELPSSSRKARFLRWQWSAVEESHRVEITPPADVQTPPRYDPLEHKRTLVSHRILRRSGTNDYGFLGQILDGFFPRTGFDAIGSTGDNPSSSFLGTSRWKQISTEAEITPGRSTQPMSVLEQHWQGWLLSRKKLFAIFDEIEKRLRTYDPSAQIIDRDAFHDLAQLQMFDIQAMLLIYEKGVTKIREELLGARKLSERALFRKLVEIEGKDRFADYCMNELQQDPNFSETMDWDALRRELDDILHGNGWYYRCLKPWMSRVLKLAKTYPSNPEKRVRWTAQLLYALEKDLEFGRFLEWLGRDHFFFQVRVSGFRKGQENGDSEYVSGSIGMIDPEQGAGPFREIADQTQLTTHELYARYLSEAQ